MYDISGRIHVYIIHLAAHSQILFSEFSTAMATFFIFDTQQLRNKETVKSQKWRIFLAI